MKKSAAFLCFLLPAFLYAQQPVLTGKITYERKVSILKQLDEEHKDDGDEDNSWYIEWRKKMPKYKTDIFLLSFNTRQSLYTTVLEDENPVLRWQKMVTELTHKSDFVKDSAWANRTVYDKKYVVADSLMKPVWQYSGEYREIAGYNCRKATTVVYDSVYIIAFFTEAIPVAGGPDFYAGLPGMIMGVVIPRFFTTTFATKVETNAPQEADLVFKPARKAKVLTREQYRSDLFSNTERWGNYANRFVLKALF